MKPFVLAVAALAAVSVTAPTASAQPYGRGGYDRGYDDGDDDYAPRRHRRPPGYDRGYDPGYGRGPGYGRQQFGRLCVTSRGNCLTRPGPFNSSCGCDIPGFGPKRGAIGG